MILFLGYMLSFYKSNFDELFFITVLIFVFIITGFKGNIDPDFNNYKYYFDIIPTYSELTDTNLELIRSKTSNVESGTIYYIAILKSLGLSFAFFYIGISIISTFLTYQIAKHFKNNKCIFLFCMLCFYVQSYFIISRFLIAILSSILIILNFNKNKKIKLSDIFIFLIGSFFHSIIYLTIPLIVLFTFRKIIIKYYSLILLLPIIISLIPINYFYFLFSLINERYIFYINRDNPGQYFSFFYRELLLLLFYSYIFYYEKYRVSQSNYLNVTLAISMLMLLFSWSLSWQLDILYRVTLTFDFGWILFFLIPYKNTYGKILIFSILTFYCLFRYCVGVNELSNYTFNDIFL